MALHLLAGSSLSRGRWPLSLSALALLAAGCGSGGGGADMGMLEGDMHVDAAAIDNDGDIAIHVGPALTYYEFQQPVGDRLTDEQWTEMAENPATTPARPAWITPLVTTP